MRYLVLVFIFLTMNTQAQTLDIIIKGTPLYIKMEMQSLQWNFN